MVKIAEKHIEELAEGVVESWDLDTLVDYAKERLIEFYRTISKEDFAEEWEDIFGDTFPNK